MRYVINTSAAPSMSARTTRLAAAGGLSVRVVARAGSARDARPRHDRDIVRQKACSRR
jgi:hypothetical protein